MTIRKTWGAALALSLVACALGCSDDTSATDCTGGGGSGAATSSSSSTGGGAPTSDLQVAMGLEHACMIDAGAVWCWGSNAEGQLGDNTTDDSATPVEVVLPVVTDQQPRTVVAGDRHSCALYADDPEGRDGIVFCWGEWSPGNPGDVVRFSPVSGEPAKSSLTAGAEHTCIVVSGVATCWGRNASGQIGDGSTQNGRHGALPKAAIVKASRNQTCAVDVDGELWCWGNGTLSPQQVQ